MKFHPGNTDKELLDGCIQKNRLAQKYLYERYLPKMMGICLRYAQSRNEALDIFNRAFLKVFNSAHQYIPRCPVSHWIAVIIRNAAIDFVRKYARYNKMVDVREEIAPDKRIRNEAIYDLEAQDYFKILQGLPANNRLVFSMHVIDGFKHHEIAQKLGISVGTSKWHLAEARKKLKKKLTRISKTEKELFFVFNNIKYSLG